MYGWAEATSSIWLISPIYNRRPHHWSYPPPSPAPLPFLSTI